MATVDLDAILASRSSDAFVEASFGDRTIKFAPLTVGILSKLSAGRIEAALMELVPDYESRRVLDDFPVAALDDLMQALYGDQLGK